MQRLLAVSLAVTTLVTAKAMADDYRWPTKEEMEAASCPHDFSHMAPKYFSFNDLDRTSEVAIAVLAGFCVVPYLTYCSLCVTFLASTVLAQFCGPQFVWTCWICGMFRPECIKGGCPLPSLPG